MRPCRIVPRHAISERNQRRHQCGLFAHAINAHRGEGNEISLMKFIRQLDEKMEFLEMDPNMAQRYLNEGFSGGEKKRNEILQLMMLQPENRHLDEIDSGS